MVMRRVEQWPLQLSRFLKERQAMPFEWGVNDCMKFASGAVLALTGFNFLQGWPDYSTKEEGDAILAGVAGGIQSIITEGLGIEGHRNLLLARRGDVVMMKLDGGITAGVVDDSGQRIAGVTEKNGLIRLPLARAWRVWNY